MKCTIKVGYDCLNKWSDFGLSFNGYMDTIVDTFLKELKPNSNSRILEALNTLSKQISSRPDDIQKQIYSLLWKNSPLSIPNLQNHYRNLITKLIQTLYLKKDIFNTY